MRTLLVDNYDSFTYNLFHELARVNGREPVVVRNDESSWSLERLGDFDCVVLSPGPGSPERAEDFGICREIIERGGLPVLGVCLGHQGLALAYGGKVRRAPEPMHGRVSEVMHQGRGLFHGLPSPFEAVRYHSLMVAELPEVLEATAWTRDGVLMGIAHRERPQWGVQFHPESVRSTYGRELLANFRELVRARRGVREASARATARKPARAPVGRRVLVERLQTAWDDEAAFASLFGGEFTFWLDSSQRDGELGRFSIMGDARGPLARVALADVWARTIEIRSASGTQVVHGDFFDWLERDLEVSRAEVPALPFDFGLGWVGYLGYELKAECGGDRAHRAEEPDAALIFADRAMVLDHAEGTTYLLALAAEGAEHQARAWLHETARKLDALSGVRLDPPEDHRPTLSPIELRHERAAYLARIDVCQQHIRDGESYELCLTNLAEARGELDPWWAYRRLRRIGPAPFAALLRLGALSVLSSSPERFLRIDRRGAVESRPIKGTRPRGATPEEDAALRAELLTHEKDRAENLMIVDLVRHDLGRSAAVGSVDARDIFRVETFATVHQLVSTVRAELRDDASAVGCVRAAFPGGSMTGAPKVRTMRILDALEDGPRGIYSGALGYFSLDGGADWSIVIRTAVITPGRVRYGVGGAIVALSDAAAEFEETALKAAPLLALTGAEFPGSAGPAGRSCASTTPAKRMAAPRSSMPPSRSPSRTHAVTDAITISTVLRTPTTGDGR